MIIIMGQDFQPIVKHHGPEYLWIIHGPKYDVPDNLLCLRSRMLCSSRSILVHVTVGVYMIFRMGGNYGPACTESSNRTILRRIAVAVAGS